MRRPATSSKPCIAAVGDCGLPLTAAESCIVSCDKSIGAAACSTTSRRARISPRAAHVANEAGLQHSQGRSSKVLHTRGSSLRGMLPQCGRRAVLSTHVKPARKHRRELAARDGRQCCGCHRCTSCACEQRHLQLLWCCWCLFYAFRARRFA